MKLRTIPGAFESLWGISRETGRFAAEQGEKVRSIFVNAGPSLSAAEGYLVSARLDGLHKATHSIVKLLRNEPEWVAFMGGKNVPIAPGIQKAMNPKLISLSDKLRSFYGSVWAKVTRNKEGFQRVVKSLEKKGYKVGEKLDDYHPRRSRFNKYREAKFRGMQRPEYGNYVRRDMEERIAREHIARVGESMPNIDQLLELEKVGAVKPGFVNEVVRPIMSRWSDEASGAARGIWRDIAGLGLDDAGQKREFVSRMMDYYKKGPGKKLNLLGRLGSKKTAAETLDAMAESLQNAAVRGGDFIESEFREIGRVLAEPAQYSLDVKDAAQGYVNSMASTWAFHSTGLGEKLWGIVNTPGTFRHAPHLKTYLVDNLMPHVLGYKAWPQLQRSLHDVVRKEKIYNWIKNHPIVENTLGPGKSKILLDHFSKAGSTSSEAIGGQIAQWFHLSTLGLNMSATSANSMQTFITTINNVGAKGLYRGLMGVGGEQGLLHKIENYMGMLAKGVEKRKAFNAAFPEFVEEMGEWSRSTERLLSGDIASRGLPKLFKAKGVWSKITGAMMAPFSTAEAGNQLLSFYAGRNQHIYQNISKLTGAASAGAKTAFLREAGQVGGSLALLTQFAGGPLGIPSSIMNMNAMWRQFMHFPMRYLAYLHGSLRMGADPSKLDWGTIGRALAGSTAAYIAARNLAGIDLSRGLMVGALPLPAYEKASFYPFPFVPPAAGVIGELGKAALSGSTENLGATLSMLVPGGIAARRIYRNLSPRFADYGNRTESGDIPIYNDDHALIGSASPMQLFLRSVGIQSTGWVGEQGAARWLMTQRDRIRTYRRDWLQSMYENDFRRADNINAEFQKTYPELGPMEVKKSDIQALENRREISRLHRILRGFPRAYKPLFGQIVNEASLGSMAQDIELGSLGGLPQNYLQ